MSTSSSSARSAMAFIIGPAILGASSVLPSAGLTTCQVGSDVAYGRRISGVGYTGVTVRNSTPMSSSQSIVSPDRW